MIRKNCVCVWLVGILDCLVLLLMLVVMVQKKILLIVELLYFSAFLC